MAEHTKAFDVVVDGIKYVVSGFALHEVGNDLHNFGISFAGLKESERKVHGNGSSLFFDGSLEMVETPSELSFRLKLGYKHQL